jgi:hypothetical protein
VVLKRGRNYGIYVYVSNETILKAMEQKLSKSSQHFFTQSGSFPINHIYEYDTYFSHTYTCDSFEFDSVQFEGYRSN